MKNERKPWKDMTQAEISSLTKRQCMDCLYYPRQKGTTTALQPCDYLFVTGQSRGCDPRDCIKEGKFEYAEKKKRSDKSAWRAKTKS